MANKALITISPFLISVDGPDGTGKSSIASVLADKLSAIFQKRIIHLVKPTYYCTSEEGKKIGREFEKARRKMRLCSSRHNSFFLRAMEANYRSLIAPLVAKKEIVVLDSSEIRALAFIIDRGTAAAVAETQKDIANGRIINGLIPKVRFLLSGKNSDILLNLKAKNGFDSGDPQSIREITNRKKAYEQAVDFVKRIDCARPSRWKTIEISHRTSGVAKYFNDVVENQMLPFISECGLGDIM